MSSSFKEIFESYLENEIAEYSSTVCLNPYIYSMQNKGKREIRPVLTLMAADSIANNFEKALPAALAIEIFHNFSVDMTILWIMHCIDGVDYQFIKNGIEIALFCLEIC